MSSACRWSFCCSRWGIHACLSASTSAPILANEGNAGLSFPSTEAGLDANNSGKLSFQTGETPFAAGFSELDLRIHTSDATVILDELRVGTTLADVLVSPVPEPVGGASVAGVLLVVFAGTLRLRTKERHGQQAVKSKWDGESR